MIKFVFFFNDTATTEIYTLSLHDALPILYLPVSHRASGVLAPCVTREDQRLGRLLEGGPYSRVPTFLSSSSLLRPWGRSEEHTSELQSRQYLVCRLLLEKKKTIKSLI